MWVGNVVITKSVLSSRSTTQTYMVGSDANFFVQLMDAYGNMVNNSFFVLFRQWKCNYVLITRVGVWGLFKYSSINVQIGYWWCSHHRLPQLKKKQCLNGLPHDKLVLEMATKKIQWNNTKCDIYNLKEFMQSQSQNNFLALVTTTCEILSSYFHSMHQQHLFQTTYLLECFGG